MTTDSPTRPDDGALHPLPPQPADVPWPSEQWPRGSVPDTVDLSSLADEVFDPAGPLHETYAVVVVHRGRLVFERYGGELPQWDRPGKPVDEDTPVLGWSMAKSCLHAVVGMLVAEGRLDPTAPAPVPAWQEPGDPRREITLEHLLEMRDGLRFAEEYVDAGASDVIEMLFGTGQADMARFAADRPLAASPGSRFNYSSGTSMVVSGIVARLIGSGDRYQTFLADRLFGPIGMSSATATCDDAGTWVASSYVHATARDYARFGLLYLRDGLWAGERLLPAGWVDQGRRPRSIDPEDGTRYGAHWWVGDDDRGSFWAAGHEGQSIDVCPALDLVLVRLGRTDAEFSEALRRWRTSVLDRFAAAAE